MGKRKEIEEERERENDGVVRKRMSDRERGLGSLF